MSTERKEAFLEAVNAVVNELGNAKLDELTAIEEFAKSPKAFSGNQTVTKMQTDFKAMVKTLKEAVDKEKRQTEATNKALKDLESAYNAFVVDSLNEMSKSAWARGKISNLFIMDGNKKEKDPQAIGIKGEIAEDPDLFAQMMKQPGRRIWSNESHSITGWADHGRVFVEADVQNDRKILKSNNLDALATAAKAAGVRNFRFDIGTADNALKGMRQMLRLGISVTMDPKFDKELKLSDSKSRWHSNAKLERKAEYEQLERFSTAQQSVIQNATPDQLKQWDALREKKGEIEPKDFADGTILGDILKQLSDDDRKAYLDVIGKKPNLSALEAIYGRKQERIIASDKLPEISPEQFNLLNATNQKRFLNHKDIKPEIKAEALAKLAESNPNGIGKKLGPMIKNIPKDEMTKIIDVMKEMNPLPATLLREIQQVVKNSNKAAVAQINSLILDKFKDISKDEQIKFINSPNVSNKDKASAIMTYATTPDQRETSKEALKEIMLNASEKDLKGVIEAMTKADPQPSNLEDMLHLMKEIASEAPQPITKAMINTEKEIDTQIEELNRKAAGPRL